ncbi:hypothetical protein RhiirA5_383135 [Rhizophagus irregularis]|uniref:Uncharacterized protein n=1 Tax=Rhizophagus irregularis TaxID=588596 RepID=A0A2N0NY69_9GLOM|nr:hypothetical protein RhiirA5_383135 [Rhizophagus irregularis]
MHSKAINIKRGNIKKIGNRRSVTGKKKKDSCKKKSVTLSGLEGFRTKIEIKEGALEEGREEECGVVEAMKQIGFKTASEIGNENVGEHYNIEAFLEFCHQIMNMSTSSGLFEKHNCTVTENSMDEDYVANAQTADVGKDGFSSSPQQNIWQKYFDLLPEKFCCPTVPSHIASSGNVDVSMHAPSNKDKDRSSSTLRRDNNNKTNSNNINNRNTPNPNSTQHTWQHSKECSVSFSSSFRSIAHLLPCQTPNSALSTDDAANILNLLRELQCEVANFHKRISALELADQPSRPPSLLSPGASPFTPFFSMQEEINDLKNSRVIIESKLDLLTSSIKQFISSIGGAPPDQADSASSN